MIGGVAKGLAYWVSGWSAALAFVIIDAGNPADAIPLILAAVVTGYLGFSNKT